MRKIFEAAKINRLDVKNRLVRSATWENMADDKGHMTEQLFKVYEKLTRGGTGLIITGYAFVTRDEQPNPGMMGMYDDAFIDEYRKLTDMVHEQGSRIVMQIAYGGSLPSIRRKAGLSGVLQEWPIWQRAWCRHP